MPRSTTACTPSLSCMSRSIVSTLCVPVDRAPGQISRGSGKLAFPVKQHDPKSSNCLGMPELRGLSHQIEGHLFVGGDGDAVELEEPQQVKRICPRRSSKSGEQRAKWSILWAVLGRHHQGSAQHLQMRSSFRSSRDMASIECD